MWRLQRPNHRTPIAVKGQPPSMGANEDSSRVGFDGERLQSAKWGVIHWANRQAADNSMVGNEEHNPVLVSCSHEPPP